MFKAVSAPDNSGIDQFCSWAKFFFWKNLTRKTGHNLNFYKILQGQLRKMLFLRAREANLGHHPEILQTWNFEFFPGWAKLSIKVLTSDFSIFLMDQIFENFGDMTKIVIDYPRSWQASRFQSCKFTTLWVASQSVTILLKSQKHRKFTSLNNLIEEPSSRESKNSPSGQAACAACFFFFLKNLGGSPKIYTPYFTPGRTWIRQNISHCIIW